MTEVHTVETSLEADIKREVRQFYNQVGWQEISEGFYQNARYEDLRPVSWEYIHRCHMRVARHLNPDGKYFLDAGSGPIQYPEYLAYSRGYNARVCADISILALQEARRRISVLQDGGHGLFVVADVANLPFRKDTFEGVISLHTFHHLPESDHPQAYFELYRVLAADSTAVVVHGWDISTLMLFFDRPIRWANRIRDWFRRLWGESAVSMEASMKGRSGQQAKPKGTFISKNNPGWLKETIGKSIPLEIFVWRSVSVRFLRALIHPRLGGKRLLRVLFWLEECFPRFLGVRGQYPLIVIRKA